MRVLTFWFMTAGQGWTRRAMAASFAAAAIRAAFGKPRRLPPEWVRFADPATEFPLLRLTDPAHANYLPNYCNRAVPRRGDSLLFWSDRTGSPQAFRIDLKKGELQQLTSLRDLDGSSIALLPGDRHFCCFDGPSLRMVKLSNGKDKEIYRVPDGSRRGRGFSVAADGSHALLIETYQGAWHLRMVPIQKGAPRTLLTASEPLATPLASPRSDAILYRRDGALWHIRYDGTENRPLPVAPGRTGPVFWSPEGNSVLYLNFPEGSGTLNSIRELDVADNYGRLVSATTQYVHFTPNADASVFAGASGSAASPYVLLLLRVTRRELTICEHRASDPHIVAPIFSPDSQVVFFQSDRHGKPAIYSAAVAALVERTGDGR
jgi:oligogalacturonide lyase